MDGCVRGVTNAAILGAAASARPSLPCACPRRGGAELRFAAPWLHAGQGVRCPHSAAVFGVGRARLANTLLRCFRWCRLPAAHKAFAFPAGGNGERAAACGPGRTLSWGRLECAVSISRNSPLFCPALPPLEPLRTPIPRFCSVPTAAPRKLATAPLSPTLFCAAIATCLFYAVLLPCLATEA